MLNRFYLWFDKISLLKKVVLVPIISMILSAIMISINYNTSKLIAQNSQELYKNLIPTLEYSTNNKLLLNQVVENFSNSVVSSEMMFIEQAQNQANKIKGNIYLIEQNVPDLKNSKIVLDSFEKYYNIAFQTTKAMIENSSNLLDLEESNALFDSLNETKKAFEDLDNEIKEQIKNNFINIEYTSEIIVNSQLYIIVFMYIILFSITFFIYKNINKRFKMLLNDIITLSKTSLESRKRIDRVSNDELGVLTSSLNEILENYENNVNQLNKEKMDYYDLSHKDKLTNLFNRHYLDTILAEYENRLEDDFIFGIVLIDIDKFKNINDTYGHQVGDEVLKVMAEILSLNVRKIDVVGRWGGEEFMCIINVDNKTSLYQIAENLRQIIEKTHIETVNNITASFGCALAEKNITTEKLIQNADKVLYEAKKIGRNKVLIY